MMYPIITSYEEMLFYLGRYDYLIPPADEKAGSATHLGDEAGDTGLSSEAIPGNADT